MKPLPEFISQTAIQPGPQVSNSPAIAAFAKFADGVEKSTAKDAQARAVSLSTNKGAIAGEEKGFELLPPSSAANRAFNKAALSSYKSRTIVDINEKINQIESDASNNISSQSVSDAKNSIAGFTEGTFSAAPGPARPFIKNYITYKAGKSLQTLEQKLRIKNNGIGFADHERNQASLLNEAQNTLELGGTENRIKGAALLAQYNRNENDAFNLSLTNKGQLATGLIRSDNALHTSTALGDFNVLLHQPALEKTDVTPQTLKEQAAALKKIDTYKKNFLDGKADAGKTFNLVERQSLVNKFNSLQKTKLAQIGFNKQTIAKTRQDTISQQENGITPAANDVARVAGTLNEEGRKAYVGELQEAGRVSSTKEVIRNSPIKEVQGLQGKLLSPETADTGEAGFKKRLEDNVSLSREAQKELTLRRENPAQAGENTDYYKDSLKTWETYKDQLQEEDPQYLTRARLFAQEQVLGIKKQDKKVLTNQSKANLIGQYNQLPDLKTKVDFLKGVEAQFGENGGIALTELSTGTSKIPIPATVLLAVVGNTATVGESKNVQTIYDTSRQSMLDQLNSKGAKLTFEQVKESVQPELKEYIETLHRSNAPSIDNENDVVTNVAHLTLGYMIKDHHGLGAAARKAALVAVTEHYKFGESFNGQTYRIPKSDTLNLSTNEVGAALNMIFQKAINTKLAVPAHYFGTQTEADNRGQFMKVSVSQAHWANVNGGIMLVDGQGGAMKDEATGNKFIVRWKDLQDKNSPINKQIDEEIAFLHLQATKAVKAAGLRGIGGAGQRFAEALGGDFRSFALKAMRNRRVELDPETIADIDKSKVQIEPNRFFQLSGLPATLSPGVNLEFRDILLEKAELLRR